MQKPTNPTASNITAIIIDQDAHGGISELSVGLSVLGVDVMNGRVGVLKSLSESFVFKT